MTRGDEMFEFICFAVSMTGYVVIDEIIIYFEQKKDEREHGHRGDNVNDDVC